jgi:uncharacterized protein YciI
MAENQPQITNELIQQAVSKGKSYTLLLLKHGPNYDATTGDRDLQFAHLRHQFRYRATGEILLAGPVAEPNDLVGIAIFSLTDKDEVARIMAADPGVVAGRFTFEALDWFGLPGDGLS